MNPVLGKGILNQNSILAGFLTPQPMTGFNTIQRNNRSNLPTKNDIHDPLLLQELPPQGYNYQYLLNRLMGL